MNSSGPNVNIFNNVDQNMNNSGPGVNIINNIDQNVSYSEEQG
jgi:hypothetical protein